MSDDDREWDEIMNDEDNPFDNPDDTFMCEENAYKAGYELSFNEEGSIMDLDKDIEYPSMATDEAIKAFKRGFNYGSIDRIEVDYGEECYEPKYKNYHHWDLNDDDENDEVNE